MALVRVYFGGYHEEMNEKLQTILNELREALAGLYGARLAMLILFGSRARGDARPDSDIDVMVVLKGPVDSYEEIERTGDVLSDLSLKHDEVLTCIFFGDDEYAEYTIKDYPLFRNVRKEGIFL